MDSTILTTCSQWSIAPNRVGRSQRLFLLVLCRSTLSTLLCIMLYNALKEWKLIRTTMARLDFSDLNAIFTDFFFLRRGLLFQNSMDMNFWNVFKNMSELNLDGSQLKKNSVCIWDLCIFLWKTHLVSNPPVPPNCWLWDAQLDLTIQLDSNLSHFHVRSIVSDQHLEEQVDIKLEGKTYII